MYLTIEELKRKLYIENNPLHKSFVEKLDELEEINSDQLQLKYEEGYDSGYENGYDAGYSDCLEGK